MQVNLSSATALGVGAVCLASFTPNVAQACGGLFCNGQQPVIQTGESIIFTVDEEQNEVEAIINVQYAGQATDFAWILPLQSVPTNIRVAPSLVFSVADQLTAPRFVIQTERTGLCTEREFSFGSEDEVALARLPDGEGVHVRDRRSVGPYESVVLESERPELVKAWLLENGYAVTDEMMRTVVPYIQKGDALLALRLQNDRDVGDIQPIWLTMTGNEVCVPIRMTAIAALADMDIRTIVLSKRGRAIPENYNHVTINLARIDWVGGGSNYRELVSLAADEGNGNAFTTEFAGSARIFDDQIYSQGRYDRGRLESARSSDALVQELSRQGLLTAPETLGILVGYLEPGVSAQQFASCPFCFSVALSGEDAAAFAEELWERVIIPASQVQTLFDRFGYATRLYTLISPEEMNVDPEFAFRTDLPDVSNVHRASVKLECGLGGSRRDARVRIEIEETGEVIFFESNSGNNDRSLLDQMPAARSVEQLNDRETIVDSSARIAELLGQHNDRHSPSCACSSETPRSSSLPYGALVIVMAVGILRRRKEA